MREKKRYLTISIDSAGKLDERTAKNLLSQAVLETLGELGAAKAGFAVKEFDPAGQKAVAKCSTKSLEEVIAALAFKRFFLGKNVALRVEKVSGSFTPRKKPNQ